MSVDNLIKILIPILPTILLFIGGQALIDRYAIAKRKKETDLDILKKSREEKYSVIKELYMLFGEFMRLYRIINSPLTDLNSKEEKQSILKEIYQNESKIESIILKIGCEFMTDEDDKEFVEEMLGNLRQSIQIWREKVTNSERLPFKSSKQEDYLRFKIAFAYTSAFMVNKIYDGWDKPEIKMTRVETILVGAFDNKYEKWNQEKFVSKFNYKKYYITPK